ncbi:hypothetical protein GCM10010392_62390 [Streptomyces clavifer]|nr:hypothetical protein GCM10010392_62390 [Streptomyces clavifer]
MAHKALTHGRQQLDIGDSPRSTAASFDARPRAGRRLDHKAPATPTWSVAEAQRGAELPSKGIRRRTPQRRWSRVAFTVSVPAMRSRRLIGEGTATGERELREVFADPAVSRRVGVDLVG